MEIMSNHSLRLKAPIELIHNMLPYQSSSQDHNCTKNTQDVHYIRTHIQSTYPQRTQSLPMPFSYHRVDYSARWRIGGLVIAPWYNQSCVDSRGHHDEGELRVVLGRYPLEAVLELGHFELKDMLQLSLPHPITVHKNTVRKGLVELIVPPQSS